MKIIAIDDVHRLNALLERILDVASWDELLPFYRPTGVNLPQLPAINGWGPIADGFDQFQNSPCEFPPRSGVSSRPMLDPSIHPIVPGCD